MKMSKSLLILVLVVTHIAAIACDKIKSPTICGDPASTSDVKRSTNEIVKRIMSKRKSDWAWDDMITNVILQVTAPKLFYGRGKSAKTLMNNIKLHFSGMTMRQKAVHIIAAKSLCLNIRNTDGIDLVENIMKEMKFQFSENVRIPVIGYDMFSIGIGAVCVSDVLIEEWMVEKIIAGQNEDGSFGDSNFYVNTVKMLPPMHSLRLVKSQTYNVTVIDGVIKKMRNYIIKNLFQIKNGSIIIEDKGLTSLALVGLWKTKQEEEDPEKWKCRALSKILGTYPGPDEKLSDLTYRLMRINGAAFLDVGDPRFKCVETDNYEPKYHPKKISTGKTKSGGQE